MQIPRAHTLNPGDSFWLLFVGGPDQMPGQGPRGRKHSLKFKAGDDIRRALVAVDIISLRVKDFTARGDDDRSSLNGQFLLLVLEIDRLGRTELLTDLASPFGKKDTIRWVNGIFQRNGLGILHMDRFSLGKSRIIFTVNFGRTFLSTETAGNTLLRVHIAWVLHHLHFKVPLLPGDAFHLGEGQELNVEMPADLDQFGREDSHGTVIGGKGLV